MYNILNNPQLGELEVIEVYEYFNMPLLFSCKNLVGSFCIALCADDLPEHDMWLYTEVSPKRLNLLRFGLINVHDVFVKPEMGRLLKATIPHNNSAVFSSKYVDPEELSENVFPPVDKFLVPKNTPILPETSSVEIAKSRGREIISFNFNSNQEYNAEAPALKLGNILTSFQTIMNVIEMERLGYSQVSPHIKNKMQFYTLVSQPGSFDIKLASKEEDSMLQLDLFDKKTQQIESEQKAAISHFFDLLRSKNNIPHLKNILTKLGLKTTNEYKKLLKSLNKLDTDVTLSWTSPSESEDEVVSLLKQEIPMFVETLKVIKEEQEKPFTIFGDLIGLSLATNRFEIQTKDEPIKPIKGYIQKDANSAIKNATISRQYRATIKEVLKKNEVTDGIIKIEHLLLNLEEV